MKCTVDCEANPTAADDIYMGILHDTGCFTRAKASTMQAVTELLKMGVDHSYVMQAADMDVMLELGMSRATFYRKKKAALRYLGYYFFEIVVPQSANRRYKPSFPVEEE